MQLGRTKIFIRTEDQSKFYSTYESQLKMVSQTEQISYHKRSPEYAW